MATEYNGGEGKIGQGGAPENFVEVLTLPSSMSIMYGTTFFFVAVLGPLSFFNCIFSTKSEMVIMKLAFVIKLV